LITDDDVKKALAWLRSMEIAARSKKQPQNEKAAVLAQKVIKELTGQ